MAADNAKKKRGGRKNRGVWILVQDTTESRISYLLDFAKINIDNLKYDSRLQFITDFERYIFRRVFRTSDYEGQVILDDESSPLDLLADDNMARIKNLQIEIKKYLESLSFALQKNANKSIGNFFEARLAIDCRVSVCKTESGDVISVFTTPIGNDKQRLMFELLSLFSDMPINFIHKCDCCGKLFYREKKAIYCTKKCMVNMNTKRYRERHPDAFKLSQQRQYEKRIGSMQAGSLKKRRQKKHESSTQLVQEKNK